MKTCEREPGRKCAAHPRKCGRSSGTPEPVECDVCSAGSQEVSLVLFVCFLESYGISLFSFYRMRQSKHNPEDL